METGHIGIILKFLITLLIFGVPFKRGTFDRVLPKRLRRKKGE